MMTTISVPPFCAITTCHQSVFVALEKLQSSQSIIIGIAVSLTKSQGTGSQVTAHVKEVVVRTISAVVIAPLAQPGTAGDGLFLITLVTYECSLEEIIASEMTLEKLGWKI